MSKIKLAYILFFLSGLCGLIYEVLWLRIIERITGNSPIAVTILLTIFMGGLAIGSHLGGRLADRLERRGRLLLLYGILEGMVGMLALLIPILSLLLQPILGWAYNSGSVSFYYMVCFLASSILIFPPTLLMGATLPILGLYVTISKETAGISSGFLYGSNTIGAATGCFITGFFLIPVFGMDKTLLIGVAANILILLSAIWIYKKSPSESEKLHVDKVEKPRVIEFKHDIFCLCLLFFTSGLVSISFELIWTNLLGLIIGPTTYSFTIVVGTFIIGIGLGSFIFGKIAQKFDLSFNSIIVLQLFMGIFFILVSQVMGSLQFFFSKLIFLMKDNINALWLIQACILFFLMLPPTLISGALFPVIVKTGANKGSLVGNTIGIVYAANSIGCIIGSSVTGFFLLPVLGKVVSVKLLILFQLLMSGICLFWWNRDHGDNKSFARWWGLISLASTIGLVFFPRWEIDLLSYGRYHNFMGIRPALQKVGWLRAITNGNEVLRHYEKAREVLFTGDGLSGFTVVQRYWDSSGSERLSLITSGKPDASSHGDRATQCLLAHIPMLFHPDPKTVMVIGLASGMTAGEVLHYPVERLDVLEINPQVLKAARYFDAYNNNVLTDKRAKIILQDGRVHLTHTSNKYDVIISEPSNPWMAGLANLFSYEFFLSAKDKLNNGGIFLQWIHSYEMDWDTFSIVGRTFFQVFKSGIIFKTSVDADDYLLLGFKDKIKYDLHILNKNLVHAMKSNNIKLRDLSILAHLLITEEPDKVFKEGFLHSDSYPILEYRAPKLIYKSEEDITPMLEKFIKMTRLRSELLKDDRSNINLSLFEFSLSIYQPLFYLLNEQDLKPMDYEKARASTLKYCEANIVTGIEDIPEGDLRKECGYYQEKLIMSHLRRFPDDWLAHLDLGKTLYAIGKVERAIEHLTNSKSINPFDTGPLKTLAVIMMREGEDAKALEYLMKVLDMDVFDPIVYFNLGLISFNRGDFTSAKNYLLRGLLLNEDSRARELLNEVERRLYGANFLQKNK